MKSSVFGLFWRCLNRHEVIIVNQSLNVYCFSLQLSWWWTDWFAKRIFWFFNYYCAVGLLAINDKHLDRKLVKDFRLNKNAFLFKSVFSFFSKHWCWIALENVFFMKYFTLDHFYLRKQFLANDFLRLDWCVKIIMHYLFLLVFIVFTDKHWISLTAR